MTHAEQPTDGLERNETPRIQSAIDRLREQLKAPHVFIAGEQVTIEDPPYRGIAETVEFYVSPASPTWKPRELNRFLREVTDLNPTKLDRASENTTSLYYPHASFSEVIGIEIREYTRHIIINEGEGKQIYSESTREVPVKRIFRLNVYPSPQIARIAWAYSQLDEDGKAQVNGDNLRVNRIRYGIDTSLIDQIEAGKNPLAEIEELLGITS